MVDKPSRIGRIQRILVGRRPARTLVRATLLALVCLGFFRYVLRPAWTDGESMAPTVKGGQLHFIDLLSYHLRSPSRGDIVAISTAGDSVLYLKRVLGLPGETVAFHTGVLYIDGKQQDEPYLVYGSDWQMKGVVLAEGEYFVAGDNRSMPRELHKHGTAKRSSLRGKLLW